MPVIEIGNSNPCKKPTGWLGRFVLWTMNKSHHKVTDWGLRHVTVEADDQVLDVGCGGGRTVSKLSAMAPQGRVTGIDFSPEAVKFATRLNRRLIAEGRVEIREGSVSVLPFGDGAFDIVTAVETHIWWPDLPGDVREVRRVLKPGGLFAIISEVYGKAPTKTAALMEQHAAKSGMKLLNVDEHRALLVNAGFKDVEVITDPPKGWICAKGRK